MESANVAPTDERDAESFDISQYNSILMYG